MSILQTEPLEITFAKKPEKTMAENFEIDCPEFLLYHESTSGNWTLKKVEALSVVQAEITKRGYNLKTTARMAVLRDLRPLGFSLFADTPEGLVKIKKQEASADAETSLVSINTALPDM